MSTGSGRMMRKVLVRSVIPRLHELGFTGQFPHLRRVCGDELHIITLQFDKWGGGFRLNLGTCPADGLTTRGGDKIPACEVTTDYELPYKSFFVPDVKRAQWFRFDDGNFERAGSEVLEGLPRMEKWFSADRFQIKPAKKHRIFLGQVIARWLR